MKRPLTRGDCVDGPRPCPHTWCRYHLDAGVESCVLDVAERGGATLDEVAELLGGVKRESVRQVKLVALRKVARRGVVLREFASERVDRPFRHLASGERAKAPDLEDNADELASVEPEPTVRGSKFVGASDRDALALVWRVYEERTR